MEESFLNRLSDFSKNSSTISSLPIEIKFDHKNKDPIIDDIPNLNFYISFTSKINSGSFNSIYKITTNDLNIFALRIPKISRDHPVLSHQNTTFYELSDVNMRYLVVSCVSCIYSLILSNVVKNNLFPNFPLQVNAYFCNNKIPISICEYAPYDLYSFCNSSTPRDGASETNKSCENEQEKFKSTFVEDNMSIIVQSLITFHFMHSKLLLSHNDAKPSNILVKPIKNTKITYIFDYDYPEYSGTKNDVKNEVTRKVKIEMYIKFLALVTDFDYTRNVDCRREMLFIFKKYYDDALIKCQNSIEKMFIVDLYAYVSTLINTCSEKIRKLSIDIIQFLMITMVYSKNCDIKKSCSGFLKDYVYRKLNIFDCLNSNFSKSVNIGINEDRDKGTRDEENRDGENREKITEAIFDCTHNNFIHLLDYNKYRALYAFYMQNPDNGGHCYDIYTRNLFGLSKFLRKPQIYKEIDLLEYYESLYYSAIENKQELLTIYSYIQTCKVFLSDIPDYELIRAFRLFKFIIGNNYVEIDVAMDDPTDICVKDCKRSVFDKIHYKYVVLTCISMMNSKGFDLQKITNKLGITISKLYLNDIVNNILCILCDVVKRGSMNVTSNTIVEIGSIELVM